MANHKFNQYTKNGFLVSLCIVILLLLDPGYGLEKKENVTTSNTNQTSKADTNIENGDPNSIKRKPNLDINGTPIYENEYERVQQISEMLRNIQMMLIEMENKSYGNNSRDGTRFHHHLIPLNYMFRIVKNFRKLIVPLYFAPLLLRPIHMGAVQFKKYAEGIKAAVKEFLYSLSSLQNVLKNSICLPKSQARKSSTIGTAVSIQQCKLGFIRRLLRVFGFLHRPKQVVNFHDLSKRFNEGYEEEDYNKDYEKDYEKDEEEDKKNDDDFWDVEELYLESAAPFF